MSSEPVTLDVSSHAREEMIDITKKVRSAVEKSGVADGLVCVYCPHTTAGLTIQENADPDVRSDMLRHLATLVPKDGGFRHGEGNADAHIKTSLVGASQVVPVHGGRLALGRWQAVFLCEFDGPRSRQVIVKVMEAQ